MRDRLRDEMDPIMAPTDRGYEPEHKYKGMVRMTTAEIASQLGITRQGVEKAELQALRKLWRIATDPEVIAAWEQSRD